VCVCVQASRDLVCFLQLDHVNVYLGQDYKSKYKAPTDYCMVLKVRRHCCRLVVRNSNNASSHGLVLVVKLNKKCLV